MGTKMASLSKRDREQFELYLEQCTDAQVHGVIEKEREANRPEYVKLAKRELERRSQT